MNFFPSQSITNSKIMGFVTHTVFIYTLCGYYLETIEIKSFKHSHTSLLMDTILLLLGGRGALYSQMSYYILALASYFCHYCQPTYYSLNSFIIFLTEKHYNNLWRPERFILSMFVFHYIREKYLDCKRHAIKASFYKSIINGYPLT